MVKLYRVKVTIKSSVKNLENEDWLINLCREIAKISEFNILSEGFSRFKKQGATAFLVLSQSHLSNSHLAGIRNCLHRYFVQQKS